MDSITEPSLQNPLLDIYYL